MYTNVPPAHWEPTPLPPVSFFTRLQQLRLELSGDKLLPHLAQCKQLRVLQLRFCTPDAVRAESLCAIVAANAATLEELCFSRDMVHPWRCSLASALNQEAEGAEKWGVLANCAQLRVLELPLTQKGALTSHLFEALAKLTAFQSLQLALPAVPSHCRPQGTLLSSALSSSSWCSVRLFLPDASTVAALRSTGGLSRMLPPPSTQTELLHSLSSTITLHRLRVFLQCASDSTERCFVLRQTNDEEGPLVWHNEY
jgi:hypothetical protein